MSEYCIYVSLPPYLAQWYAHHCREHHFINSGVTYNNAWSLTEPIVPIKDSYVSLLLKHYLSRQPTPDQEKKDNAERKTKSTDIQIAIALPYFKEKDPRVYNYIGPKTEKLIIDAIREAFKIDLWEELYEFDKMEFCRIDELIYGYMENHHIADEGSNWDSIAKLYQRMKKTLLQKLARKNYRLLAKKNSD